MAPQCKFPEILIFAEDIMGDLSTGLRPVDVKVDLLSAMYKYKQEVKSCPTPTECWEVEHLRPTGCNLGKSAHHTASHGCCGVLWSSHVILHCPCGIFQIWALNSSTTEMVNGRITYLLMTWKKSGATFNQSSSDYPFSNPVKPSNALRAPHSCTGTKRWNINLMWGVCLLHS